MAAAATRGVLDARSLPGCRSARSRVGREDVGDGSAAEGRSADRLDGERCVEEPVARAKDDRMHDEPVFVDQADRNERPREPRPALRQQVSVGALLLELRHRFGKVAGGNRRLGPVGGRSEFENTTLGISFIGLAKGPAALGQNVAQSV